MKFNFLKLSGLFLLSFFFVSVHYAHAFTTPDILNNASFENGWNGFTNWSSGVPFGVSRAIDTAYDGSTSIERTWTPNPNADGGSQLSYTFPVPLDRVWVRFYFKATTNITTIMKFARFYTAGFGTNLGGIFMGQGNEIFTAGWDQENSAITTWLGLSEAQVLDGNWHSLEIDYWRNGDPSGYPSMAFWFDGNQVSEPDGTNVHYPCPTSQTCNKSYWLGGRLYAGERGNSQKMSVMEWVGTLNQGNTTTGQVNLDDISISSLGRIGPATNPPTNNPSSTPTSPSNPTSSILGLGINTVVPPTTSVTSTTPTPTTPSVTTPAAVTTSSSPSSVSATPISGSEIDLSWTASTGAVSYNIYRCNGSSCNPNTLIGTSTTTTYKDTSGLHPNNNYTYGVKASDASNNISSQSTPVFATSGATPAPVSSAPSSSTPTTPTSSGTGAVFTTNLQLGSKGPDVTRLQTLLAQDKSIYPEGLITGTFGSLTRAAVMRFQIKYKIITSALSAGAGRVGPLTRMELGKVY